MSFVLMYRPSGGGSSAWRVVDQAGQEVVWLNQFLDAQRLRGLAHSTLRTYAVQLLHFVRWWAAHQGAWCCPPDSALHDYVRWQLDQQPPPSVETINGRLDLVRKLCRFHFGEGQAINLHLGRSYWRRSPLGYGRPRLAWSQWRLKRPRPVITPLSAEQVQRFWSSFHTCRDMLIVALMLLNGLRSGEVLALQIEDVSFSESQIRVMGKGRRQRFLPLPAETLRLLEVYLRSERPQTTSQTLFVSLKGKARGTPMTPAGLRSLFRYHRGLTGIAAAHPHRFRHYAEFRTMPSSA